MIIVDSHCHLDMLTGDTIDNIVQRAHEMGVKYLQTICTKLDNFENILSIARRYDNIYASVGIHPSEVKSVTPVEKLLALSSDSKVIGLDETGLDYFYNKELHQQSLQRQSFIEHIYAAQSNNLPVIIHSRDAEDDMVSLISEHKKYKEFPALIHCFTSNKEFAAKMLDLGLYISISGIITFKNTQMLREAVKYIPLDRLLVETDSPYLTPIPHRGKTNEPSYIKYVVDCLAQLKDVSAEELANKTTDNFFKLFSKTVRID